MVRTNYFCIGFCLFVRNVFLILIFSEGDNVFLSPLEEKRNIVTKLGGNSRPTSPLSTDRDRPARAPADQLPGGGDSQLPSIGIEQSNVSLLDLAYKTALGMY